MPKLYPLLLAALLTPCLCLRDAAGQEVRGAPRLAPTPAAQSASAVKTEAAKVGAWPAGVRHERLSEIGRGKGVIFSPDLSVPTNRKFYERLGFSYFEDASWYKIIKQIRAHNDAHPENRIEVLILETHGTNGNGLKLQAGHQPAAPRSYVSVGGLQEKLEGAGVKLCIIAACNAGRLFRPHIYNVLQTRPRDPLFLPATLGVINSSPGYHPKMSSMRVMYPTKSNLETTNEGSTEELSPEARALFDGNLEKGLPSGRAGERPWRFVVSDILIQMLLHDPRLSLNEGGYEVKKSRGNFADHESEELFQQFLDYVNGVAARDRQAGDGT